MKYFFFVFLVSHDDLSSFIDKNHDVFPTVMLDIFSKNNNKNKIK